MISSRDIVILLACGCLIGCTTQRDTSEQAASSMTASGVLTHYPADVRSRQSWLGHTFMVGDTPVIPSSDVPEKHLLTLVGKEVVASGTWHPGDVWTEGAQPEPTAAPVEYDIELTGDGIITGDRITTFVRGDGIRLSTIQLK